MKIALTTTLDDSYVIGFLITFASILNCSPNFNYDLIIFEWGELSNTNKYLIRTLYSNVSFKMVNVDLYKNHEHDDTWRKWNYNCNYRFDIFTLKEYERVVFFDSDMVFEIDINELIKESGDFSACIMPNCKQYNQIEGDRIFNAGLMSISKKYLNDDTRDELIKIANSDPIPCEYISTNKWFGNQPILNKYFLSKLTALQQKFNFMTSDVDLNTFKGNKNYHYVGCKKPWHSNDLSKQFDDNIRIKIASNVKNVVIFRMFLKNLIEKYELQKTYLLNKGINI
jgi:lipopolysaccharide biosynthesis glycosyltransferase